MSAPERPYKRCTLNPFDRPVLSRSKGAGQGGNVEKKREALYFYRFSGIMIMMAPITSFCLKSCLGLS